MIVFLFSFDAVIPPLSPSSLLLSPLLIPPPPPYLSPSLRVFLPVSPVTSRPSLQHQHRGPIYLHTALLQYEPST